MFAFLYAGPDSFIKSCRFSGFKAFNNIASIVVSQSLQYCVKKVLIKRLYYVVALFSVYPGRALFIKVSFDKSKVAGVIRRKRNMENSRACKKTMQNAK